MPDDSTTTIGAICQRIAVRTAMQADEDAERRRVLREDLARSSCDTCGGPLGEDPVLHGYQGPGICLATCRACVGREARAQREAAARQSVERDVGRRYARCERGNLDGDPALLSRLWQCVDARGSCLIFGPNGTGKTHASAVIYRDALADGRQAVYRVATELADDLRAAIEENAVRKTVDALRKAEIVILDDLAMERPTDWVLEQLCRVIDWRYRDESQMVITTNLGPKQLRETYGERITSRLLGIAGQNLFKLAGRDRREDGIRRNG